MNTPPYSFKRLSEEDDVQAFDCGTDKWDTDIAEFLRDDALKQQKMGLNITWLCRLDGKLVGYVSLVASRFELKNLLDWIAHFGLSEVQRKLKYVPCMMIGRFAVDSSVQRKGVGKHMLSFARGAALKSGLGMRFATIDVDKCNDRGFQFWVSQGFIKVQEGSDSRFMVYDLHGEQAIEKGD